jgi:hypothetical protein
MKKKTAVLSLATVAGFSVLSATPAMAVGTAYDNCSDAAAQGVYNIPAGSPGYGTHLDSDLDGIGCENSSAAPAPAPAPADNTQQVTQMPVGGADTGVPAESPANISALALTGGLVLAAAGGGTYLLRRRAAAQV